MPTNVSEFRFPRNAARNVAGMPSRSFIAERSRELSIELIPGVEPLAIAGRPKPAPGGLSEALKEMDGTRLCLAALPPWLFC